MTIALVPAFTQQTRNVCCSICGRGPGKENPHNPISADRPVLSTGIEIDMEGWFEICLDCAAEIGAAVGMISEETAEILKGEVGAAEDALLEMEDRLDKSTAALEALAAEVATRG